MRVLNGYPFPNSLAVQSTTQEEKGTTIVGNDICLFLCSLFLYIIISHVRQPTVELYKTTLTCDSNL